MPASRAISVVLLFVGAACSTRLHTSRETGFLNRAVTVEGIAYRFQVYLPPEYTRARSWPVIPFLHGAGHSGDDGILPTDHGIATALRQDAARFPAVVVFPQARAHTIWFGSMERQALAALDQSRREFNGDRRRVYLTGLSMGAYGAWQFAAQHPGLFAAIVPVAGGIVPPMGFALPPEIVALERAGNRYLSGLRSADPDGTIARMIGDTPVWVFHGDNDRSVPVSEARQLVAALRALGGRVRYTEYPGEGHGITDRAYADNELAAWLFAQAR